MLNDPRLRHLRARSLAWAAAHRLLGLMPRVLHPYLVVQAVAGDVVAALGQSFMPSGGANPYNLPTSIALGGVFRRAIPLSVVVAARLGLRDPAPVAGQKPNGRRARRGGGR